MSRLEHTAAGERLCDVGGDITLCYETLGDRAGVPMLLIMGLAQQLIAWPDDFCAGLVERGFQLVRFDNRDIGRSTRMHVPPPTRRQLVSRRFGARQYDLGDMAGDTAGLIEALGLGPVHVVGISMGGMIGQTLAARHPQLVRTLTSIMSTTGHRWKGQPAISTYRLLLRRPAIEREAVADGAVRVFRHVASPGYQFDPDAARALALRAFDRGYNPAGVARQMAAILKSGDRTLELRRIAAPTLVIHGDRDLLVNTSGGRATAAAIPGARLEIIEGLGHDLPAGVWPRLVDLVAEHAAAADRAPA